MLFCQEGQPLIRSGTRCYVTGSLSLDSKQLNPLSRNRHRGTEAISMYSKNVKLIQHQSQGKRAQLVQARLWIKVAQQRELLKKCQPIACPRVSVQNVTVWAPQLSQSRSMHQCATATRANAVSGHKGDAVFRR